MPVVYNKETGLAEDLPPEVMKSALQAGTHEIPLVSPEGERGSANTEDAPELIKQGYRQPKTEELKDLLSTAEHTGTGQQIAAGIEGLGRGVLGPVSDAILTSTGVNPEDIKKRKEVYPGTAMAGDVAGLVGSGLAGVGLGGALEQVGKAVIPQAAKGASLATKIMAAGGRGAVENALYGVQSEVSKKLINEPQTAESAIANVGMAALLGAGIGGGLGAVGAGFDGLMSSKASQFVNDFKGRISEHLDNPDPLATLTKEMQGLHEPIQNQVINEVYGKSGLRQEELAKLLPEEMSPKLAEHNTKVINDIGDTLGKMQKNAAEYPSHNVAELQRQYGQLVEASQKGSPQEVYNALNEFKRYSQGTYKALQKTDSFELPHKFLKEVQDLGKDVRASLEDNVWGAAGKRTAAINKAWSEFQTPLKEFNSKFTTKLGDEKVIDPGKVNTYLRQIGKPNAEIKQEVLSNFLDASKRFTQTMDKTHANLGIENPVSKYSEQAMLATLQKQTAGSKVADALIEKGLSKLAGSAVGGAVGSIVGHPALGAIIGAHSLDSVMKDVLPALIQPMLKTEASGTGFKSAINYAIQAVKGENKINKAAASVFGGHDVIQMPSGKDRELLQKQLKKISDNPDELLNTGHQVGHYMPEHASQLAAAAMRSTQYLDSLKPNTTPQMPLDEPRKPSDVEESIYNRALDIAQNPLIVLKSVKDGSITLQDINHLKTMFPALYTKMSNQLVEHLIDVKTDKSLIPYKTKLGVSMFMGQPLDSSMRPAAIIASQGVGQQASQMMAPTQKPKSMNKLDKLPGQTGTMVASREQYRTSRH